MSSMVQNVGLYAGCMRVVRSKTIGKGGGGLPNAGVKRAKAGRIVYQEDKTRIHFPLLRFVLLPRYVVRLLPSDSRCLYVENVLS